MSADLAFACQCGQVRGKIGDVTPEKGDYIVCHCSDCQRFATHLNAGERILDPHGGTHLYQSRCACMEVMRGKEKLSSIHLTDKPTLRWYANCCDTPMFNSYRNGRVPYITTLLGNCDAKQCDTALGQPVGHLFVEEATSDPGDVPHMSMSRLMQRFAVRMVKDFVSGDRRRSALFDAKTLEPIAKPVRLSQ